MQQLGKAESKQGKGVLTKRTGSLILLWVFKNIKNKRKLLTREFIYLLTTTCT